MLNSVENNHHLEIMCRSFVQCVQCTVCCVCGVCVGNVGLSMNFSSFSALNEPCYQVQPPRDGMCAYNIR